MYLLCWYEGCSCTSNEIILKCVIAYYQLRFLWNNPDHCASSNHLRWLREINTPSSMSYRPHWNFCRKTRCWSFSPPMGRHTFPCIKSKHLPVLYVHMQTLHDGGYYIQTSERDFMELASYYHLPVLSVRSACYDLMVEGNFNFSPEIRLMWKLWPVCWWATPCFKCSVAW